MKLEAGQRYIRRDGFITGFLTEDPSDATYTFCDPIEETWYTSLGEYYENDYDDFDLIEKLDLSTWNSHYKNYGTNDRGVPMAAVDKVVDICYVYASGEARFDFGQQANCLEWNKETRDGRISHWRDHNTEEVDIVQGDWIPWTGILSDDDPLFLGGMKVDILLNNGNEFIKVDPTDFSWKLEPNDEAYNIAGFRIYGVPAHGWLPIDIRQPQLDASFCQQADDNEFYPDGLKANDWVRVQTGDGDMSGISQAHEFAWYHDEHHASNIISYCKLTELEIQKARLVGLVDDQDDSEAFEISTDEFTTIIRDPQSDGTLKLILQDGEICLVDQLPVGEFFVLLKENATGDDAVLAGLAYKLGKG